MTHDDSRFSRRTLLAASAAGAAGWLATTGGPQASGAPSGEPSAEPASAAVSWSRQVPIRYEAAVVVLGGGIAGVSAACAAAQSGARVVLVERFAITGGDLTVGGVANFCGDTKGQGEVFDAIVADLEKFGAVAPYKAAYPEQSTRVCEHHVLALVLQELLLRRGVKLLLHTQFVDTCTTGQGRITACIVCGNAMALSLRCADNMVPVRSGRFLPLYSSFRAGSTARRVCDRRHYKA